MLYFTEMDQMKALGVEKLAAAATNIDFMQNMPLPQIPVQDISYYTQFRVYTK